jgi:hypothetical protein
MTSPEPATPQTAITAGVAAAQAADQEFARNRKPDGGGWQKVPDSQVRRLLTAAVPLLHAAWAADEHTLARETIINALAAKFGPHKAYDRAAKDYLPDGDDAEGSCMIVEPHEYEETWHTCGEDDGHCDCQPVKRTESVLRPLTYGDIAGALAHLGRAKAAAGEHIAQPAGWEQMTSAERWQHIRDRMEKRLRAAYNLGHADATEGGPFVDLLDGGTDG